MPHLEPPPFFEDVSHDPVAQQRAAVHCTRWQVALEMQGFGLLGLMKTRPKNNLTRAQIESILEGDDAEMLIDVVENGDLTPALISPDGEILATIENFFGGPLVSLHTLLVNGVIIETTMEPVRRPIMVRSGAGLQGFLVRAAMSGRSRWPRENRPQAGIFIELVKDHNLAAQLTRHRQRMVEIRRQYDNPAIYPLLDLPRYVILPLRSEQVGAHRARQQNMINRGLMLGMIIAVFLMLIFMRPLVEFFTNWSSLGLTAPLFIALGFGVLALGLMSFASALLARLMPGPALQPASELHQKAVASLATAQTDLIEANMDETAPA
ncbi:MAG TPA: hypothetical protein PKG95_02520 [Anaerolineaceae bacterium]|jgi:hypothetical protein|nr:hypothetical protein [Anaerolineaceae bacterium]